MAPESNSKVFAELLKAHEKHVGVRMDYNSIFERKTIQTLLFPYTLHFVRRAWYVTGRSSFHREIRTFHLERIQDIEIIPDATFVIPTGWNYEKFRGNAWNMIRGPEDVNILLRFSARIASNVASVHWHKTQRVHKNPDGTLDFRVCVSGTQEIIWWILGYGDQVEVLEPESLREEIKEKIQKMNQIYENQENTK